MGNNQREDSPVNTDEGKYGIIDAELAEVVKMSIEKDNAEAAEPVEEKADEANAAEDPAPAKPDAEAAEEIGDDLTERAVRAGLSLAEIKGITSKDVLEGIIGRLEGAGKAKGEDEGGEENPADGQEEDPLASIDWDEYEPQIATVMKALAAQNADMRKEIASLRKAGESATTQSFFDTQFGKLGEGVTNHVDAVAKGKLKQKFDMLEAGYKAVGAKVDRAEVFGEAARLVLGDKLDAAKAESDAAKLAKRKALAIAPPTHSKGAAPKKTEADIDREIADFLEKKYPGS